MEEYGFKGSDAQNLSNSVEAHVQCESVLEKGHKNIDRNGDPDLALHSVFGGAGEGLYPPVLLDPLETGCDGPARATRPQGCVMAEHNHG